MNTPDKATLIKAAPAAMAEPLFSYQFAARHGGKRRSAHAQGGKKGRKNGTFQES